MNELLLQAGEWDRVTPASAGWRYLSFEVFDDSFALGGDDSESVLIPLGGLCRVRADGRS